MTLSRLELISSRGDQALSRVRFVVHGSSNAGETAEILTTGLRFVEGRPTVSTNLVHAADWTMNPAKQAQSLGAGTVPGEPGEILVVAVPPQLHLGYGVFTTAYIDRSLQRVTGAPLRFAAARKQLAFYTSGDMDEVRMHIESEVANGYTLDQRPAFLVEPKYVLGRFVPNATFMSIVNQLEVTARMLQPVEFERAEVSLRELFQPTEAATAVLVPSVVRDLVVGTVESVVLSRLRMMRWQGLALLGYRFMEGKDAVEVAPVASVAEQRRRMDEMGRQLASSSLFAAELAWLKGYAAHELELMRMELDAADLERADS